MSREFDDAIVDVVPHLTPQPKDEPTSACTFDLHHDSSGRPAPLAIENARKALERIDRDLRRIDEDLRRLQPPPAAAAQATEPSSAGSRSIDGASVFSQTPLKDDIPTLWIRQAYIIDI
jgi:hypothetical protein